MFMIQNANEPDETALLHLQGVMVVDAAEDYCSHGGVCMLPISHK